MKFSLSVVMSATLALTCLPSIGQAAADQPEFVLDWGSVKKTSKSDSVSPAAKKWAEMKPGSSAAARPQTVLKEAGKPIIGINIDTDGNKYQISKKYIDAIKAAGGIPVIIPPLEAAVFERLLPGLDGMLMIGGEDYPPTMYGKQTEAKTVIMQGERADFDAAVVKAVLARASMPYLGICAGSQILNIASGGELIQDIPTHKPESKISHSGKDGWQGAPGKHVVTLSKNSKLAGLLGDAPLAVPTSHHQCVSTLGKNLVVAATAEDGITEAVEAPGDRFVVGVQWHPERDFERNAPLFKEFVKQADLYHKSKY
jgi:putative glutamine amidotransferase